MKVRNLYYPKVLFINLLEQEAFLQRHQSETITVYINKDLKKASLNLLTAIIYKTFKPEIKTPIQYTNAYI